MEDGQPENPCVQNSWNPGYHIQHILQAQLKWHKRKRNSSLKVEARIQRRTSALQWQLLKPGARPLCSGQAGTHDKPRAPSGENQIRRCLPRKASPAKEQCGQTPLDRLQPVWDFSEQLHLECMCPPMGVESRFMLLWAVQIIQVGHFCSKGSQAVSDRSKSTQQECTHCPGCEESHKLFSKEHYVKIALRTRRKGFVNKSQPK